MCLSNSTCAATPWCSSSSPGCTSSNPSGASVAAGRRALTPPDPQLKGTWYPGGFNLCAYQVKTWFQSLRFKRSLHRYVAAPSSMRASLFPRRRRSRSRGGWRSNRNRGGWRNIRIHILILNTRGRRGCAARGLPARACVRIREASDPARDRSRAKSYTVR
jgi:hypothetical protein